MNRCFLYQLDFILIVYHQIISNLIAGFLTDLRETVAFTAILTPSDLTGLGSGQAIRYDYVITNVGNAYHSTTGIFTAPVSGVYVFNYAILISPDESEFVELVVNGHAMMNNYGHATGSTHYVSASRTATLDLTTGDEVWVQTLGSSIHGTGAIHGHGFTTFSGWLHSLRE